MRLSFFASVKLTISLLTLIACTILIGAWCPQESQQGFQKVTEVFGSGMALTLHNLGITDIFHTPFFLLLIGLLTINMIACSFQRVFPKLRLLKHNMPFLSNSEITKFATSLRLNLNAPVPASISSLSQELKKRGYKVSLAENKLTAEWGKPSKLAATITHIGLLSLLAGVTITSWTGFSGFKPVPLGGTMSFNSSEHSKLWLGKLPDWKVKVLATRRENYKNGDPKQWYSTLAVIDKAGKSVKEQEISVNNPLSYGGVDIYQSSWALDSILLSFNNNLVNLPLQPMGNVNAAFLPLEKDTILIFSLPAQDKPLRVFGKIPQWNSPRMLAEIPAGNAARFSSVAVGYHKAIPVSGLQYKCDPGLPLTYIAFSIIITGVLLATVPHKQVWAFAQEVDEHSSILYIGGVAQKAKKSFESSLEKISSKLKAEFGTQITEDSALSLQVLASKVTR